MVKPLHHVTRFAACSHPGLTQSKTYVVLDGPAPINTRHPARIAPLVNRFIFPPPLACKRHSGLRTERLRPGIRGWRVNCLSNPTASVNKIEKSTHRGAQTIHMETGTNSRDRHHLQRIERGRQTRHVCVTTASRRRNVRVRPSDSRSPSSPGGAGGGT